MGSPIISVVTPAYRAADTIEDAIRSIGAQHSPWIEHIVVDGGSTDGTVDILHRYSHVTWVSEPDAGQADALNKGFKLAHGEVIGWLNADDLYSPGALARVVELFARNPEIAMIHGDMTWIDQKGRFIRHIGGREFRMPDALLSNPVNQQPAFLRRTVFDQIGYMRTDLHYVMDYEFWLRLGMKLRTLYVPEIWASFRMMPGTKTVSHPERFWLEILRIYEDIDADPSRSGDFKPIKRLAYGRMHWLAATGLCRIGDFATAGKHAALAIEQYDLLGLDYAGAISACRYIEAHEFDAPKAQEWIDGLIENLPAAARRNRQFVREVRSLFYATRADFRAFNADMAGVRGDTARALKFNPAHWLSNRGFLRQGLGAWTGPHVAQLVERFYRWLSVGVKV